MGHRKEPSMGHRKEPSMCHRKNPACVIEKNPAWAIEKNPAWATEKNPACAIEKNPACAIEKNPACACDVVKNAIDPCKKKTLHNNLYFLLIKCVSKYGICDINTVVNIKDSFTIAEMSQVQYLHTHLNNIK